MGEEAQRMRWKYLLEVMEGVQSTGCTTIVKEYSGVGDSQANGDIEEACTRVQQQTRTLRSSIEQACGAHVESTWHIWPWMVEHAAWTIRNYCIDDRGRTAEENRRGQSREKIIIPFGESVLYRLAHTIVLDRCAYRWEAGVMLGIIDVSGEYIIGTSKGVVKTPYTPKGLEKEKQYNAVEIRSKQSEVYLGKQCQEGKEPAYPRE